MKLVSIETQPDWQGPDWHMPLALQLADVAWAGVGQSVAAQHSELPRQTWSHGLKPGSQLKLHTPAVQVAVPFDGCAQSDAEQHCVFGIQVEPHGWKPTLQLPCGKDRST